MRPTANLCLHVVEAVADAEGVDPVDLEPPMYGGIDRTALNDLFDGATGATAGRNLFD